MSCLVLVPAGAAQAKPVRHTVEAGPPKVVTPADRDWQPAHHGSFAPRVADPKALAAAKARATLSPAVKPGGSTLSTLAPPHRFTDFAGVDEATACSCSPPDSHGTVTPRHVVEVTNSHLDIYKRDAGYPRVVSESLNSFFGAGTFVFDPRAMYDPVFDRTIIIADSDVDASGNQTLWVAVSKTHNPAGAYNIYGFQVVGGGAGNAGEFFDYPQLGMDRHAILVTANEFHADGSYTGRSYFFKKSDLYNGRTASFWFYNLTTNETMSPSFVLDNNPTTWESSAPVNNSSGTVIYTYGFQSTDADTPVLVTNRRATTVPAYVVPPAAAQPGTTTTLDTLDDRFQNAGAQVGNPSTGTGPTTLYQAHAVGLGSFPAVRYYKINADDGTLIGSNTVYKGSTSYDWNPSIMADYDKDVYLNWSDTDPTNGIRAQVRFGGFQAADGTPFFNGTGIYTSPARYTQGTQARWGDYSSVVLDPRSPCGAGKRAWLFNEDVPSGNQWGNRIARVGFC